jgi:sulfite exporter TauE/SafE
VIALASSVFVAGLLGSAHCAGMCGSFACLAAHSEHSQRPTGDALRGTLAYSLGRLVSYATLGLLAGAAGAGLNRAGDIAGIARPATTIAGVLLVLWGVATLLALLGVRVPALAVTPALADRLARAVRAVREMPAPTRGVALGALSAALPCGWLYAFVASSAAAGSALGGGLVMAAFWAGTLPAIFAVALGVQRLLGPVRRRLPLVTAVAMIVLGLLTVAGRLSGPSAAFAQQPSNGAPDALHAHD